MNNIPIEQNKDNQLELLFTQRALYSEAKSLFAWRTIMAVLLAILGPLLTALNTGVSTYTAIAVVTYLLLDNFILQKIESGKKISAAKIQEVFDTTLFGLHWNKIVAGEKPDKEVIRMNNPANPRDYSLLKLMNWYAPEIGEVSLSTATFLCQRSNVWWDSALRQRYLNFLYAVSAMVIIFLIVLAVALNITVAALFLRVFLPMVPLGELLIKQIIEHHGSGCCSTDLKENLNETLLGIIQGEEIHNPNGLARTYQDEIYRHRSKCPMVFDWMYWIFQDRQEKQMRFSVEKTVEDILKSNSAM